MSGIIKLTMATKPRVSPLDHLLPKNVGHSGLIETETYIEARSIFSVRELTDSGEGKDMTLISIGDPDKNVAITVLHDVKEVIDIIQRAGEPVVKCTARAMYDEKVRDEDGLMRREQRVSWLRTGITARYIRMITQNDDTSNSDTSNVHFGYALPTPHFTAGVPAKEMYERWSAAMNGYEHSF